MPMHSISTVVKREFLAKQLIMMGFWRRRRPLVALIVLLAAGACVDGRRAPDPDTEAIANQAGCDVIGGSCGDRGQCCDIHDDCIDRECGNGFGGVGSCTQAAIDRGDCTAACRACHNAVTTCIFACGIFGGAGCGPSVCCAGTADPADDTCGDEQACYDRTKVPPELITDPCECARRMIDLSKSPPRPEAVCCEDNGWGCCAAEGDAPGPGGARCCAPLVAGADGKCVPPPPPSPTPTATPSPPPSPPPPSPTPSPSPSPSPTAAPSPTPTASPSGSATPRP